MRGGQNKSLGNQSSATIEIITIRYFANESQDSKVRELRDFCFVSAENVVFESRFCAIINVVYLHLTQKRKWTHWTGFFGFIGTLPSQRTFANREFKFSSLQQKITFRSLKPHLTKLANLLRSFLIISLTKAQFLSNWQTPFEPSCSVQASPETKEKHLAAQLTFDWLLFCHL